MKRKEINIKFMNEKKYALFFLITLISFFLIFNYLEIPEDKVDIDFELVNSKELLTPGFVHDFTNTYQALNDTPFKNVLPILNSVGISIAVADINSDGYFDFYVTNGKGQNNSLYINQRNGSFKEDAALFGIANLNQLSASVRAIFFDDFKQGRLNLLLTTSSCPRFFYQNTQGVFVEKLDAFNNEDCAFSSAVNLYDFNKDGYLDIIMGSYISSQLPNSITSANNGSYLKVYLNDGHNKFKKVNILNGNGRYFYHSIAIGDFRESGLFDLWVVTDFNDDKVFINNGNSFDLIENNNHFTTSKSGMGVDLVYLDKNYPSIYVTHVHEPGYLTTGNALWTFDGSTFVDSAIEKEINRCGFAWGAKFLDLNNNGQMDLIVLNGFISNEMPSYWYPFSVLASSLNHITSNPEYWPDMRKRSLSAKQRDCVFINSENKFTNKAADLNFDDQHLDGRAIATIDPLNDGNLSLIIGNQNQDLAYYKVKQKNNNSWIGFEITENKYSVKTLGAIFTLYYGDNKIQKAIYNPINSYSAQSEPRIKFGLALNENVKRLEVKWPGEIKPVIYTNLSVNQYNKLER